MSTLGARRAPSVSRSQFSAALPSLTQGKLLKKQSKLLKKQSKPLEKAPWAQKKPLLRAKVKASYRLFP